MSNRFLPTPCPRVNHSSEIRNLPWVGNHAADSMIFHKIDDYIYQASTSVEERIRALTEMSKYGMGSSEEVTLQELEMYLRLGYDTNRITFKVYLQYLGQIVKWVPLEYPVPVGTIVRWRYTGERGVIKSGGKHAQDPLVISVTEDVSPNPELIDNNHSQWEMKVYKDPQIENAFM